MRREKGKARWWIPWSRCWANERLSIVYTQSSDERHTFLACRWNGNISVTTYNPYIPNCIAVVTGTQKMRYVRSLVDTFCRPKERYHQRNLSHCETLHARKKSIETSHRYASNHIWLFQYSDIMRIPAYQWRSSKWARMYIRPSIPEQKPSLTSVTWMWITCISRDLPGTRREPEAVQNDASTWQQKYHPILRTP